MKSGVLELNQAGCYRELLQQLALSMQIPARTQLQTGLPIMQSEGSPSKTQGKSYFWTLKYTQLKCSDLWVA